MNLHEGRKQKHQTPILVEVLLAFLLSPGTLQKPESDAVERDAVFPLPAIWSLKDVWFAVPFAGFLICGGVREKATEVKRVKI